KEGNSYVAGSFSAAAHVTGDASYNVYIIRNNELLGWIDMKDEIRNEAKTVIALLHSKNIKTILLSGDRRENCDQVAGALGIDEVFAERTPQQKLEIIAQLNAQSPTAMVG